MAVLWWCFQFPDSFNYLNQSKYFTQFSRTPPTMPDFILSTKYCAMSLLLRIVPSWRLIDDRMRSVVYSQSVNSWVIRLTTLTFTDFRSHKTLLEFLSTCCVCTLQFKASLRGRPAMKRDLHICRWPHGAAALISGIVTRAIGPHTDRHSRTAADTAAPMTTPTNDTNESGVHNKTARHKEHADRTAEYQYRAPAMTSRAVMNCDNDKRLVTSEWQRIPLLPC